MTQEQEKVVTELIELIDKRISPPLFDSFAAYAALGKLYTAVDGMLDGVGGAIEND